MLRLGLADHLGWAVAVIASEEHAVVDRRRLELVEPGVCAAPIHYERAPTPALVDAVRASVERAIAAAFSALPSGIVSLSLRVWPPDFPTDFEVLCRAPWEARADAVMYRVALAEAAHARGWEVHGYEAKSVEAQATALLGARADAVLHPGLGPPWTKDHRAALAATVLAGTRRGVT